ncbi:MAG: apolipoprotein N-acyltransferase [Spirochaetes bacterium]|nr:apolipoprotein N-acyltransferase [Spirochaetota bacterium]
MTRRGPQPACRPQVRSISWLAVVTSSILLFFSFPNPLLPMGAGFLSWIALVPLFLLVFRLDMAPSAIAGILFGFLSRMGTGYWLADYHPLALLFVEIASSLHYALLFAAASCTVKLLRAPAWLAWSAVWLSFDALRSLGPLADSYGSPGYALYRSAGALRLASWGGVASVSLAIVAVNALIARALLHRVEAGVKRTASAAFTAPMVIVLMVGLAGMLPTPHADPSAVIRVDLIQPDIRHRQSGPPDYQKAMRDLIGLSERALDDSPDLIVWHETAVVPPVEWHLKLRSDREVYESVAELWTFLERSGTFVLFGNGTAEADGGGLRKNFNSARLFGKGGLVGRYDKIRLVPFAERVPLRERFPGFAEVLETRIGTAWTPGTTLTLFDLPVDRSAAIRFAAPICFEDSFPGLFDAFADKGADFFIVLTDDSWSHSSSCEYQHLAMSCFRAAETGLPVLRDANTGITAHIDPNGIIRGKLPPFASGILTVNLEIAPRSGRAIRVMTRRIAAWIGPIVLVVLLLGRLSLRLTRGRLRWKNGN